MADAVRQRHQVAVHIAGGWLGEFTVCLDDGRVLARKRWLRLPAVEAVLQAVARALQSGSG